ncbi:recombinase family protein [Evansella sp. AB-P1]|uniref:recombinase family protein n=1 Tax=Evansella sp. AB-P1 TaxID=3037653 RepID=UPI00242019F3|nr:recombinase family protein [Evansella sp. AB-P1]MDG5789654.1 recombinase family protein [Evansella sp. AB-P1]
MTTVIATKTACIYLRLSREKKENEDSLKNHRLTLTSLAEREGYNFKIYSDGIASSMDGDRLEYNLMIDDIKNGMYSAIFAHDVDRLSRNGATLLALSNMLEMFCPNVITPSFEYDLRDDSSKMMFSFGSIIAEQEYRQIKKRLLSGKIASAKQGKCLNSLVAYGYTKDEEGKLVPDEDESKIVREAVELCLQGLPYGAISQMLNIKGYRGKKGGKFTNVAIQRYFTNPIYRGTLIYSNARGNVELKNNHEPLITDAEYQLINEMAFNRRKHYNKTRDIAPAYVIAGMVTCEVCGIRMPLNTTKRNGKLKGYYETRIIKKCSHNRHTPCENYGVALDGIERAVINSVKQYSKELETELGELKTDDKSSLVDKLNNKIKDAEKAVKQLGAKEENLLSLAVDGLIDNSTFKDRQAKLQDEKKAHLSSIEEHKNSLKNLDSSAQEKRLCYLVGNINKLRTTADIRDNGDYSEQEKVHHVTECNAFLKSIISKIGYYKESRDAEPQIKIEWLQ